MADFVCAFAFAFRRKAAGNEWVMIAFSKLGFIGKTFRSSRRPPESQSPASQPRSALSLARLPKLAEFLLAFHDQVPLASRSSPLLKQPPCQAPCDWLVWIFIDAAETPERVPPQSFCFISNSPQQPGFEARLSSPKRSFAHALAPEYKQGWR